MGRKSGQLLARRTAQVNPSSYRGLWRFAQISRSGIAGACRTSRRWGERATALPMRRNELQHYPFAPHGLRRGSSLPGRTRQVAHVLGPLQSRAAPDALRGRQLRPLRQGAHAQRACGRVVHVGARRDWRAAAAAERMAPPVSAGSGLHVEGGRAAQQAKGAREGGHGGAIRGAAQNLAIGAVAERDPVWVDLGLVGDQTAMAAAVDLHADPFPGTA